MKYAPTVVADADFLKWTQISSFAFAHFAVVKGTIPLKIED